MKWDEKHPHSHESWLSHTQVWIQFLRASGILTDTEADRAHKRLFKQVSEQRGLK
jgi:hypothetical protein